MRLFVLLSALVVSAWTDNSYVVVVPSEIRSNMDLTLSVNILKASSPVTVTAELKKHVTVLDSKTDTFTPGVPGTITLRVPSGISGSGYSLAVKGSGGLQFSKSTPLQVSRKEISVFIQTDKAIYKPRDTVYFRTFAVYADLKPYNKPLDISVYDGKENKVLQLLDVKPDQGVISSSFPLSTQPVLGDWKISVSALGETGVKTFVVDEYVLPKFDVEIKLPPYVIVTDPDIVFKVKATYTYGKPVSGVVDGQVKLLHRKTLESALDVTVNVAIDGEAEVRVSLAHVLASVVGKAHDYVLQVNATVTESISSNVVTKEEYVEIFDKAVVVKFAKSNPRRFKPGLLYTAYPQAVKKICQIYNDAEIDKNQEPMLKVTRPDGRPVGPMSDKAKVTIIATVTGGQQSSLPKQHLSVPENGLVAIRVDAPADALKLKITARISFVPLTDKNVTLLGQDNALTVDKSKSPSDSYLQLSGLQRGDHVLLLASSTKPMKILTFQVISRGIMVKSGYVNANGQTSQTLRVTTDSSMAPSARIIVYYVQDNGEIVTDSVSFDVDGIFKNKVFISVNQSKAEPNDRVTVTVQADPNSIAHMLAIDQSVLLLQSGNDVTVIDVYDQIKLFDTTSNPSNDILPTGILSWPFPFYYSGADAKEMFEAAGVHVITDALVYNQNTVVITAAGDSPVPRVIQRPFVFVEPELVEPPRVRFHFPETWLWQQLPVGSSGSGNVVATIPDTITSWVMSAFAINANTGLGVAAPTQLTVFLPFFVSLNLPYSIIRGEQLAVQALVFNYLDQDLLSLLKSKEYYILSRVGNVATIVDTDAVKTVVVGKGKVNSVRFPIIPVDIGKIDIEVKAQSTVAADAVRRQLLVEPEGVPKDHNIPVVIDLATGHGRFSKIVDINLPDTTVNGSELIRVTATGELLGPSIAGLEKLLRMPTGCAEQTMVKMAPNVYITSYLTTFGVLTEHTRLLSLKYMTGGYQNVLKYKRHDGSFSAFGNKDKAPSMWLTAFVARVFHQARDYIYIETKVITNAINWITRKQNSDGSFPEPGRVIHWQMQGKAQKGSALTAFVLLSLLENENLYETSSSNAVTVKQAIDKAVKYVENAALSSSDLYLLALSSYALQLAGSTKTRAVLDVIEQKAKVKDGHKFWQLSSDSAKAIDIEITSYVLLTYAARHDIQAGLSTMHWIIQQRNTKGGLYSTQV